MGEETPEPSVLILQKKAKKALMRSQTELPSPTHMEQHLQSLMGLQILEVTYVELDYESSGPMWGSQSPYFDSLDFGVELALDDGSSVSITWEGDYHQYGVSLSEGPLKLKSGPVSWPASERWRDVLKTPIKRAGVFWSFWESLDQDRRKPERRYFPQDIRLEFEGGDWVTISAFEFRADGGIGMPGTDNITVFFREQDLERFSLCSHGPNLRSSEVPWPP